MSQAAIAIQDRDQRVRLTPPRTRQDRTARRRQALRRLQTSTRRVMGSTLVAEMRASQVCPPDLAEVRQRLSGLARPLSAEVLDDRRGR